MKKKLVSLVLCMALLSSLTVGVSAYDLDDIYIQVMAIKNELGYPDGNYSSLRRAVNYIADNLPSSYNYSTVLSNIKSNTDTIASYIQTVSSDVAGIAKRIVEVQTLITGTNNRVDTTNSRLSTINTNMQNLIAAASQQNHSDWNTFFYSSLVLWSYFDPSTNSSVVTGSLPFANSLGLIGSELSYDCHSSASGDWTLYHRIKQLQEVLASDDDLALKNANKANEEAVKSDFVNGSSSKTSLGVSDFGNLKDVGGTFNDLTSLNGQSSISSFLSGITSADTTGQGWFSETTRASLDAVSTPVSSARLVQKTWRGEKSMIYTLEADTSVSGVRSVAGVAGSAVDPFNMAGFTDNYLWLWGDAS